MSRTHSELSKIIIDSITQGFVSPEGLFERLEKQFGRKTIYDALFRLEQQGLIERNVSSGKVNFSLSVEGERMLYQFRPRRDGVWKIVIFDIPEKRRKVRGFLRNKLKTLGFKKWQESIWISPFALDPGVESELNQLAETLFIRLIKTKDINYTKDLEELFKKGA